MRTIELKVARIGNSRGVRLPAACLRRYRIGDAVTMEERSDGIMLRAVGPVQSKLTWEETARAMEVEAAVLIMASQGRARSPLRAGFWANRRPRDRAPYPFCSRNDQNANG